MLCMCLHSAVYVSAHYPMRAGSLRVNGTYYILKQLLPALERLLQLLGADVRRWYLDMPRSTRDSDALATLSDTMAGAARLEAGAAAAAAPAPLMPHMLQPLAPASIRQHFLSINCILCDTLSKAPICSMCARRPQEALYALLLKRSKLQADLKRLNTLCSHCAASRELAEECQAIDCSAYYSRAKAQLLWSRACELESWCTSQLYMA